jgi:hypothetical protein
MIVSTTASSRAPYNPDFPHLHIWITARPAGNNIHDISSASIRSKPVFPDEKLDASGKQPGFLY